MSEQTIDYDALAAEFIGTFGLVFIGGMAVMQSTVGGLSLLGVAMAHMLVLSFMVYFGGRFSGAHYNPAITTSFLITKKMDLETGIFYIATQLLASIVAGIFLEILATDAMKDADTILGFPGLSDGYSPLKGIFLEAVLTFFLVFVVWAMAADSRAPSQIFGLAIGGTVGFGILAGGPLTGAALNPARVLGPALIGNNWADHYVFWLGPIIGGILAGLLYFNFFLYDDAEESIAEALIGKEDEKPAKPKRKPSKAKAAKKKPSKKKKAAKSQD